jgi:tight adherence protein B
MRRALALLAFAVVAFPAVAVAQTSAPVRIQDVDAAGFPNVRLLVVAASTGTVPASGFTVLEGDVEYPVDSAEPVAGESIEAVLVMDVSGSMAGAPLDGAKAAALVFVDALPNGARVGLVTFGSAVTVVEELTPDLDVVRSAIDGLSAGGNTAFYDGVLEGLTMFTPGGADNLVVLTDGADTSSEAALSEVEAALSEFDGAFFGVFLQGSEFDTAPIEAMAEAAGGSFASADDTDAEGLALIFSGIASEVTSQYVLTYSSEGSGNTELRVAVAGVGTSAPFRVFLPVTPTSPPETTTTVATSTVPPTVPPGSATEPPRFSQGPWLTVGLVAAFVGFSGLLYFLLWPGGKHRKTVRPSFRTRGSRTLTGVSRGLVSAVERVGSEKGRRGLDARLDRAGLRLRAGEFVVLVGALALLAGVATVSFGGSAFFGLVVGVLAVVVGVFVPAVLGDRRQRKFEDQMPDVLSMLASTIRTGYAPIQATELVSREMADPSGPELARAVAETRLGRDYIDALRGTATRMESDDFEWVVESMEINRDVGGDVSEILDRVAETIRARVQLRRLVSALTAEGRLSAWILVAVPFFLAWFLYRRDPEFLTPLVETTVGIVMLVVAAVLMVVGILVIRALIKVEE